METEDNIIFKSVVIACIAGIVLISLLTLTGTKDNGFTELYFLDYEKAPAKNAVTFKYGITNHEGKETEYNIRFLINNNILRNRKTTLKDNETFTEEYTLPLDTNHSVTHKVIVDIQYLNKTQGIHFYTMEVFYCV